MCFREKSGGNLYRMRAQATPEASPEIEKKTETPEECG
jgi:hypothetical protein